MKLQQFQLLTFCMNIWLLIGQNKTYVNKMSAYALANTSFFFFFFKCDFSDFIPASYGSSLQSTSAYEYNEYNYTPICF